MAKKTKFEDPLKDIDPVMEGAFSDSKFSKESSDDTQDSTPAVSQLQFPTFDAPSSGRHMEEDIFGAIPITVSVELGRSEMTLKEVYELSEGSIIEVGRLVGEPLDLIVNGQTIAQGEVVAVDNNYGLRLTQIISKSK